MAVADPAVVADLVAEVARAFGLGPQQGDPELAARGRQGQVWRVQTESGRFSVKELLVELTERDVQADVAFQSAMQDRGVPTVRPLHSPTGAVLVRVGGRQFRAPVAGQAGPAGSLTPATSPWFWHSSATSRSPPLSDPALCRDV